MCERVCERVTVGDMLIVHKDKKESRQWGQCLKLRCCIHHDSKTMELHPLGAGPDQ